jgi:hypothetical protein
MSSRTATSCISVLMCNPELSAVLYEKRNQSVMVKADEL